MSFSSQSSWFKKPVCSFHIRIFSYVSWFKQRFGMLRFSVKHVFIWISIQWMIVSNDMHEPLITGYEVCSWFSRFSGGSRGNWLKRFYLYLQTSYGRNIFFFVDHFANQFQNHLFFVIDLMYIVFSASMEETFLLSLSLSHSALCFPLSVNQFESLWYPQTHVHMDLNKSISFESYLLIIK